MGPYSRLRREQSQPESLGEELRHELTLDAVAGGIQGRGKRAHAALAGRDGNDAAADPALAWQPDVVEPVTRGLVQPGGRHHRQHPLAVRGVDYTLPGERVDTPVGQRRAHDREVPGGDVKRALSRIESGRLEGVEVEPVI